jgi:hypothetical protein
MGRAGFATKYPTLIEVQTVQTTFCLTTAAHRHAVRAVAFTALLADLETVATNDLAAHAQIQFCAFQEPSAEVALLRPANVAGKSLLFAELMESLWWC